MSSILYYSNYCQHSKKILNILGKSNISESIHFINIDNRFSKNNETFVKLENGQELLLPSAIVKVPALLLINKNHQVLFGNDILQHLNPVEKQITQVATNNNMEPNCYSLATDCGSGFGVTSDNFSFLDMTSDDLSAKGDGGTRQMYSYSSIYNDSKIETPDDDYKPDKINESDLEKYQRNRDIEIKR